MCVVSDTKPTKPNTSPPPPLQGTDAYADKHFFGATLFCIGFFTFEIGTNARLAAASALTMAVAGQVGASTDSAVSRSSWLRSAQSHTRTPTGENTLEVSTFI